MIRDALQTVFSQPVHPGLGNLSLSRPIKYSSKIDPIYAIVLCAVLGVAAIALSFTRYQSGSPFFAKQAIKLPIFRFRPYDSLPTENGNGVDHEDIPKVNPEPLVGWRYRLGILQNAVLLALIFVHALILLTVGVQLLRIVFIAYWSIALLLNSLRYLKTLYRRSLYNTTCVLGIFPLIYHLHVDIVPRLFLKSQAPGISGISDSEIPEWQFNTVIILTVVVNMIPLITPRVYRPVNPADNALPAPQQICTPISYYLTFFYVDYLVRKGTFQELGMDDLPPLPDNFRAKLWRQKYVDSKYVRTLWKLLSLTKVQILWMIFWALFETVFTFGTTISMQKLLAYLEDPSKSEVTPYIWVIGLLIVPIMNSAFIQQYFVNSIQLTANAKAALVQALYEKTLRVRIVGAPEGGEEVERNRVGRINNLMSDAITGNRDIFFFLISVPLGIMISLSYLCILLGWSALVGFACMAITFPVPTLLYMRYAKLQQGVMKRTDERIGVVGELLNSVRVVKYFGWERAMISRIDEKRDAEQKMIWKRAMLSILISFVNKALPLINLIATLFTFTVLQRRELHSSIAFTSISLFQMLSSQFIYVGMITRSTMLVSLKRVDQYLNEEEEIDEDTPSLLTSYHETDDPPSFSNATLSWTKPEGNDTQFQLRDLDITFSKGELNLIVGPIGSGKSSLLLALLGEMRTVSGEFYLPRQGGVAYVSQTAWLQNATIRDNILFGSDFDEERYWKVIDACALKVDLDMFEAGDRTEVGEKGITLSGGQKQRLALARAVYSSARTVLLDDVLSALDVHVGKYIFEKCITGELLRGRTVLLVTHHVNMAKKAARNIIVMGQGRIISAVHSAESLANLSADAQRLLENAEQEDKLDESAIPTKVDSTTPGKPEKSGKLVLEEERAVGRISRRTMFQYMANFGSPFFLAGLWCVVSLGQTSNILNNWWIAKWSDAYAKHGHDTNAGFYLAVAGGLAAAMALIDVVTSTFYQRGAWSAAKKLHSKLVRGVFRAPISWFDVTPVGRIINRFAKDITSLDSRLLMWLQYVIDSALQIIFRIGAVSSVMPIFVVPALVVACIGYVLGEVYVRANIAVKRCQSITESPLFSHFGDTILGAVTIRAYLPNGMQTYCSFGAQDRFAKNNLDKIDTNLRPYTYLFLINRWINIRADTVGSLMAFTAAILALRNRDTSPGLVGFSLVNASGFGETILYLVRTLNELEIELNSFERVMQYATLTSEPLATENGKPPAAWPTDGDVVVKNLSVKYALDGPKVLSEVSFSIKSKERVGICGRTGSGKSTLCLTLLRFTTKVSGSIVINGIDIDNINLEDLRDRVSIIPQDAILFSGTIRTNLDPFGRLDDAELNMALRQSGLLDEETELASPDRASVAESSDATTIEGGSGSATPKRRITLDSPVTSNGDNFSQGQRQILALARALVRRSKVIILDEATASVDHATDERIQQTLRSEFKESTLITIAHRLRTIMDYDKILVLDEGKVAEFDTPLRLLEKRGIFHGMVAESGEYDALVKIAKEGN